MEIWLNDAVTMKKPHACGTNQWRVVRIGADIGLICNSCNRRLLLSRSDFIKKVKKIKHTPDSHDTSGQVIINRLE